MGFISFDNLNYNLNFEKKINILNLFHQRMSGWEVEVEDMWSRVCGRVLHTHTHDMTRELCVMHLQKMHDALFSDLAKSFDMETGNEKAKEGVLFVYFLSLSFPFIKINAKISSFLLPSLSPGNESHKIAELESQKQAAVDRYQTHILALKERETAIPTELITQYKSALQSDDFLCNSDPLPFLDTLSSSSSSPYTHDIQHILELTSSLLKRSRDLQTEMQNTLEKTKELESVVVELHNEGECADEKEERKREREMSPVRGEGKRKRDDVATPRTTTRRKLAEGLTSKEKEKHL